MGVSPVGQFAVALPGKCSYMVFGTLIQVALDVVVFIVVYLYIIL